MKFGNKLRVKFRTRFVTDSTQTDKYEKNNMSFLRKELGRHKNKGWVSPFA